MWEKVMLYIILFSLLEDNLFFKADRKRDVKGN